MPSSTVRNAALAGPADRLDRLARRDSLVVRRRRRADLVARDAQQLAHLCERERLSVRGKVCCQLELARGHVPPNWSLVASSSCAWGQQSSEAEIGRSMSSAVREDSGITRAQQPAAAARSPDSPRRAACASPLAGAERAAPGSVSCPPCWRRSGGLLQLRNSTSATMILPFGPAARSRGWKELARHADARGRWRMARGRVSRAVSGWGKRGLFVA